MNLPFFIAKRYLFSKRKRNFINIISGLTLILVAVCTASLIIVLSVFNGLEHLLRSLNQSFDPQIKIEAVEGKSFEMNDELRSKIKGVAGVAIVTEVIEDYAYARYREANQVVKLKGVSDNFIDQHRIDNAIAEGELALKSGQTPYAIVGRGVQYSLSIQIGDNFHPLQIYYINNVKPGVVDISKIYSHQNIIVGAAFSIVQSFDENYVIVPLEFARDVMQYGNKRTSLEIKVADNVNPASVQSNLQAALGKNFSVLSLEEQHKDLYRLLKIEKLFAFGGGVLLLGIASINIFFSLMMLVLDKKKDISLLASMGADQNLLRKVFLTEGALIAVGGTLLGLVLGATFCFFQQRFGFISMGMQNSVTEGYPVKMILSDFVYITLAMVVITFLVSYRPAQVATRTFSPADL
ncbi:MAG TPA: ABC transporter permease [Cyclobacteriaceae bacterium]|nr:ABC transporter permease [Cyclobacteriaceae bacterium]HMV07857.1 ABC transporter permease [Cyclobacteriaceae bacterium]HMV88125.1 ABC transporter permease [Cyclobacteriaceae bacterium]HMW98991.1 ABC transporter permease [Cyclobacteriaceae bacterium]HMX48375.1 ABC transporter permease [Cyclobacteriaceae bacterium]